MNKIEDTAIEIIKVKHKKKERNKKKRAPLSCGIALGGLVYVQLEYAKEAWMGTEKNS